MLRESPWQAQFPLSTEVLHGRDLRGIVPAIVTPSWSPLALHELRHGAALVSAQGPTVWFAQLAAFAPLLSSSADIEILSADERQRAAAMSSELVRRDFLLSRLLLRRVLGACLGNPIDSVVLHAAEHGKPTILAADGSPAIHFNQSHSQGLWLLGVTRTMPVGVDIEGPRVVTNAERLAKRVFTAAESAELAAAAATSSGSGESDRVFLGGWTRKEAVLKAVGSGFSWPANEIHVGTDDAPRRVALPRLPDHFAEVWSFDLPVDGRAAAATLSRKSVRSFECDAAVSYRELHP